MNAEKRHGIHMLAALLLASHGTAQADSGPASLYRDQPSTDRLQVSTGLTVDHDPQRHQPSAKLEATYILAQGAHPHAIYSHALLAPAAAMPEPVPARTAEGAIGLALTKADKYEIGLKGSAGSLEYQFAINTHSRREASPGKAVSRGKSRHRGLDAGLGWALSTDWRVEAGLSYARHGYLDWGIPAGADYGGRELATTPGMIGNLRLTWQPAPGRRLLLEWVKQGEFLRNHAETAAYEGSERVNLRATWEAGRSVMFYGSIHNLLDQRYADPADPHPDSAPYAPDLPRTVVIGIAAQW